MAVQQGWDRAVPAMSSGLSPLSVTRTLFWVRIRVKTRVRARARDRARARARARA